MSVKWDYSYKTLAKSLEHLLITRHTYGLLAQNHIAQENVFKCELIGETNSSQWETIGS